MFATPSGRGYSELQYIIQGLEDNPQKIIDKVKSNLQKYCKKNGDWASYMDWERKLSLPVEEIIDILKSPDENAVLARANSPFSGCIPHRERWAILRKLKKKALIGIQGL